MMLKCESDVFIWNISQKLEVEILGSSRTFLLHMVPIYSYFRLFKNTSFCKTGHFRILIINVPTYHLTCRQYFLGTLCTTFLVGPPWFMYFLVPCLSFILLKRNYYTDEIFHYSFVQQCGGQTKRKILCLLTESYFPQSQC